MSIVNKLKVLDSVTSQYVTADFGITDLNKSDDVNVSSPANGEVLKYDSATQKWINSTVTSGTVTDVTAGAGLSGGTITRSGTIKANLKSETESALTAASKGSTADREYAVGLDANGNLAVNVPWTDTTPVTSVNGNIGAVNLDASDVGAINSSLKGANSGVAELDENGKVPTSQLPSYVDDVLEYTATTDFPATGESGKIYVATSTNLTYRWSGSTYVEISPSIALGETSATAYRGDRGKAAYDHSQVVTGNPHGTKYEDLANVTTIIKVLEAGATTLTFTNNSITATSTFNLYSDVFGVVPTDMVQSGTSLTLTYPAQESNVNIKLVVTN